MKNKIRTLIVDDEPLGRAAMRDALVSELDIKIIGECANGFEAVQAAQKQKPDLMFLDIQMPKLDGFDVAELLGPDAPLIIFVTAYDEFAVKAFETKAIDYLLKPVQHQRLQKSLERARQRLTDGGQVNVKQLIDQRHDQSAPLARLLIREGAQVHIIPTPDIVYLKAEDDFVMVHTKEKSFLKYDRMANLEQKLDPQSFCRIHRSYLLNINFLDKIEPWNKDQKLARLKTGQSLPISRSGHLLLRRFL